MNETFWKIKFMFCTASSLSPSPHDPHFFIFSSLPEKHGFSTLSENVDLFPSSHLCMFLGSSDFSLFPEPPEKVGFS